MMHISVKSRYYGLLLLLATVLLIHVFLAGRSRPSPPDPPGWVYDGTPVRSSNTRWDGQGKPGDDITGRPQIPLSTLERNFFIWGDPDKPPRPKPPYKPPKEPSPPIPDPFPLLSQNPPPDRTLLRAPKANRPTLDRHGREPTPLFVGFTRNWPQLLQCVVSYIAAGWPPEEIYVVENTGVMHANWEGKLTLQNPFYLNHTQLHMLGVNVIITPTLLTFSQLQNFYLWTALDSSWPYFFWTHQDVIVFSHENLTTGPPSRPPTTLHQNALATLRYLSSPSSGAPRWAHHFFFYDHLALVHRDALLSVGGWDTHIPFYGSDCDTYVRLMWAGFWQGQSDVGMIFDVGTVLEDLGALLRLRGVKARVRGLGVGGREKADGDGDGEEENGKEEEEEEEEEEEDVEHDAHVAQHGETWDRLVNLAYQMEVDKYTQGNAGRNKWQAHQRGGHGEPFYRDPDGFETGVQMLVDAGRAVFAEKWGHRGCDIARAGIRAEDAWRLERDWDEATEGPGFQGDTW
ncbi:hypothetical protein VTK26DRAFT_56 [Humicola hyalothermophila]